MVGASAIQIGTATFVEPYAIPKIIKGVNEYLNAHGYSGIGDIAGIARDQ